MKQHQSIMSPVPNNHREKTNNNDGCGGKQISLRAVGKIYDRELLKCTLRGGKDENRFVTALSPSLPIVATVLNKNRETDDDDDSQSVRSRKKQQQLYRGHLHKESTTSSSDETTTSASSSETTTTTTTAEPLSAVVPLETAPPPQNSANQQHGEETTAPAASSADEDEVKKNEKRCRSVSFSDLTIRSHAVVLGDNPGGTGGPPLTIEWGHFDSITMSIEEYERLRPQPRRRNMQMKIPSLTRTDMLRRNGFSRQEIAVGTKAANSARAQRKQTRAAMPSCRLHESLETFRRELRDIVTLGAHKRRERAFLEPFEAKAASSSSCCSSSVSFSRAATETTTTRGLCLHLFKKVKGKSTKVAASASDDDTDGSSGTSKTCAESEVSSVLCLDECVQEGDSGNIRYRS